MGRSFVPRNRRGRSYRNSSSMFVNSEDFQLQVRYFANQQGAGIRRTKHKPSKRSARIVRVTPPSPPVSYWIDHEGDNGDGDEDSYQPTDSEESEQHTDDDVQEVTVKQEKPTSGGLIVTIKTSDSGDESSRIVTYSTEFSFDPALSAFSISSATPKRGVLYCDGSSKGNHLGLPGPSGVGVNLYLVDYFGNQEEKGHQRYIGDHASQEAEYLSLIEGMEFALSQLVIQLTIRMDSELVVKQMRGEYEVKADNLEPLYYRAQELCRRFRGGCTIQHILRQENTIADQRASDAVDEFRALIKIEDDEVKTEEQEVRN